MTDDELDAEIVDHTDDEFDTDEPMDVGAVMGQSEETDTSADVEEDDETDDDQDADYGSLVTRAAHGLAEGYFGWDDIDLPGNVEREQFEADVEDKLVEIQRRTTSPDEDDQPEDTGDPRSVDWAALWEEFGFDSPDACGDQFASTLQLETAIEVSDQGIEGSAESHRKEAVRNGTLHELTTDDESGTEVTRGYAFTVGGGA